MSGWVGDRLKSLIYLQRGDFGHACCPELLISAAKSFPTYLTDTMECSVTSISIALNVSQVEYACGQLLFGTLL